MSRSLPESPRLEHLRKEAKDILQRQRRKDPAACEVLRLVPGLRGAPDERILGAKLTLAQVQKALAADY